MIKLVEQFENQSEFSVEMKDLPFDFVGYTSDEQGNQVISKELRWKPWNQFDPANQNELEKNTRVYATVSAKPITIKLDPNGGQEKANNTEPKEINTHYYMSPSIHSHAYEREVLKKCLIRCRAEHVANRNITWDEVKDRIINELV